MAEVAGIMSLAEDTADYASALATEEKAAAQRTYEKLDKALHDLEAFDARNQARSSDAEKKPQDCK